MTEPVGFSGGAPKDDKSKPKKPRKGNKSRSGTGAQKYALSPKKIKAIEGVLEGKSPRRAALDAGYSASMASHAKDKVFTGDVLLALNEELEALGCTRQHLARRIYEGTNAEKIELAKYEGQISDERAYPDLEQRGKYIDRALELGGYIKRSGANVEVNMPITLVHSVPRPSSVINGQTKVGD